MVLYGSVPVDYPYKVTLVDLYYALYDTHL